MKELIGALVLLVAILTFSIGKCTAQAVGPERPLTTNCEIYTWWNVEVTSCSGRESFIQYKWYDAKKKKTRIHKFAYDMNVYSDDCKCRCSDYYNQQCFDKSVFNRLDP